MRAINYAIAPLRKIRPHGTLIYAALLLAAIAYGAFVFKSMNPSDINCTVQVEGHTVKYTERKTNSSSGPWLWQGMFGDQNGYAKAEWSDLTIEDKDLTTKGIDGKIIVTLAGKKVEFPSPVSFTFGSPAADVIDYTAAEKKYANLEEAVAMQCP